MAILAIFTGTGITRAMYESLRKEVKWESDKAPGGVFHAAAVDASGHMHVADVWESAEALNAFVGSRLMPAMQKLKIPPPQVDVYETVNVNAFRSVEAHILK